ncbi:MAG: DUF885 domain-containing protein [Ferruginibacter sp.]
MKHVFFAAIIIFAIAGCNDNTASTAANPSSDTGFQRIAEDYLKEYLAVRPQSAVALGFHDGYDGKTSDFSKKALAAELERLKAFDKLLATIDITTLHGHNAGDYQLLSSAVKKDIYNIEDERIYSHNPMTYAGAVDVNIYIKRNFAPLEERVKYIISTENAIPALFANAKLNLDDSLPKPYIETAIEITQGNAGFLKGDLLTVLKDIKNDSLMALFRKANDSAIKACDDFVSWLTKEKLPRANNYYAIGKANYKKMLLYGESITMEPEQILAIGMQELQNEQKEFIAAAKIINPRKKAEDVYRDLQNDHPSADSLISVTSRHLESIRQFLIDHKICSIPSEVRVQVKETPQYARSTSTASMDMAGPFEKKATESYYYITPVEQAWTAKQKEDWLRQFDYYTADNVSIHEAYPGHYMQGLHLNASPATKIQKIFGSYAFVEGWAHYCEKMMVEEGFGAADSITAAKHRLAMSGDALLRICRLCVSVKMHCQGMTIEEGTKFFMDNWHQGEKPSYQEALRGSFDPGYLFYTVGKLQVLKLRDDYKKQEGGNFSLQKFHDALLGNGMPPIVRLREILLKDRTRWSEDL